MDNSKKRAILYANTSDAVYFPTSIEVMVCRVVPTARANCSCDRSLAFRSSRMRVLIALNSFAKSALQCEHTKLTEQCQANFAKRWSNAF